MCEIPIKIESSRRNECLMEIKSDKIQYNDLFDLICLKFISMKP